MKQDNVSRLQCCREANPRSFDAFLSGMLGLELKSWFSFNLTAYPAMRLEFMQPRKERT
jgi:hypothetical protein